MGQTTGLLVSMVLMLVVFYLVIFIPENRRRKKYNSMLNAIKLNDEIVTRGGIVGKIINIQDDFLTIQTGPDRAKIKITKNAVSSVTKEANTEETK